VAKQQLEKAGFKVDLLAMDWQTVVSRRARKEAPAQGGWNLFFTTNITLDLDNPGINAWAAGTCEKAWFGWPCDPEIEVLRAAFIKEGDPAKRKELGYAISDRLMDQGFYAPVGSPAPCRCSGTSARIDRIASTHHGKGIFARPAKVPFLVCAGRRSSSLHERFLVPKAPSASTLLYSSSGSWQLV